MRHYGITLYLVSPVKPELVSPVASEKTYRPVQSFSTNISYDAGASD